MLDYFSYRFYPVLLPFSIPIATYLLPEIAVQKSKLTKRTIDQLAVRDEEYVLWDSELRGLGLKVLPSGKKVFVLFYRTQTGRQRRPVIGQFGALTVDQARDLAREWLVEVSRGGDPSGARQLRRKALTVKDLGARYLAEHAAIHKKASSAKEDRRMLLREIYPKLGQLKVEAVHRADVMRFHQSFIDSPYTGNRCRSLLSKMFNLAELWELRPDGSNPCRHVKKFPERTRDRYLSADELARIGDALSQMTNDHPELAIAAATIKFLALTGCRLSEVATLKWAWVNFDAGTIDFPDSKTGAKRIPLGDAAVATLNQLETKSGVWVFPGSIRSEHIKRARLEDVWKRVRKAAALEDARLHDFRHTVGTYSGQAGHNAFIVRDILGHKTLSMTNRYVGKDMVSLRKAATTVAAQIFDFLNPGK
ncbi:MAG: tyrosine-type recombinase/integrase [Alphaproteobacteria bacterium]